MKPVSDEVELSLKDSLAGLREGRVKMSDEFVVRCPEPGVAVPQNVLLHEYVLHRDYQGGDRVAFLDGITGRTITHQQVSNVISGRVIAHQQVGDQQLYLPFRSRSKCFFPECLSAFGGTCATQDSSVCPSVTARQQCSGPPAECLLIMSIVFAFSHCLPRQFSLH